MLLLLVVLLISAGGLLMVAVAVARLVWRQRRFRPEEGSGGSISTDLDDRKGDR